MYKRRYPMPLKNLPIITLFLLLSLPLAPLADDVIWEYNDDGGIYTARPIPDLDDDGIDDVVFAGYYSDFKFYHKAIPQEEAVPALNKAFGESEAMIRNLGEMLKGALGDGDKIVWSLDELDKKRSN